MSDLWVYLKSKKVTADLVLGVLIMGLNGMIIGLYFESPSMIMTGLLLGAALGGFVSAFGARRFFLSILTGTALGGLAALWAGGPDTVMIGAGSGAAIGGFIGINLELFLRR